MGFNCDSIWGQMRVQQTGVKLFRTHLDRINFAALKVFKRKAIASEPLLIPFSYAFAAIASQEERGKTECEMKQKRFVVFFYFCVKLLTKLSQ